MGPSTAIVHPAHGTMILGIAGASLIADLTCSDGMPITDRDRTAAGTGTGRMLGGKSTSACRRIPLQTGAVMLIDPPCRSTPSRIGQALGKVHGIGTASLTRM